MTSKYLIKETAPFVQFSSVKVTDAFNPLFDIEAIPRQTLEDYCQQLINKTFSLSLKHIPVFISHHCNLVKKPLLWLNKFEKLIELNIELFSGTRNQSRLLKIYNCLETKREKLEAGDLDENKIKIKGRATCGWNAIGTVRTVTKSEGNHVYTIDDIPVLDLTARYSGMENVSPDNKNLILELTSTLPLQMQREHGDPVMRPGLMIDWDDHSFYCSGSVPQGSKVRFSLPPDFDVVEKVIQNCEELKATEMAEADAVIVFSCAGRQFALGPMIKLEMEGIQKIWNVPMAGMFSNAELARANGGNLEMHNCTTCCVVLKEK